MSVEISLSKAELSKFTMIRVSVPGRTSPVGHPDLSTMLMPACRKVETVVPPREPRI